MSHCVRGLSEEASGLRSRRPWSLGCVPRLSLELLVVPRMRKKEIAGETKVESRKTLKMLKRLGDTGPGTNMLKRTRGNQVEMKCSLLYCAHTTHCCCFLQSGIAQYSQAIAPILPAPGAVSPGTEMSAPLSKCPYVCLYTFPDLLTGLLWS